MKDQTLGPDSISKDWEQIKTDGGLCNLMGI